MKFGDCVLITSNDMLGIVLDRILPTPINGGINAYLIKTSGGLVLVEPKLVKPLNL